MRLAEELALYLKGDGSQDSHTGVRPIRWGFRKALWLQWEERMESKGGMEPSASTENFALIWTIHVDGLD